jgi:hypothetical protein
MPLTRGRILRHLDRPLGFYCTLFICGLLAVAAWEQPGARAVGASWPALMRSIAAALLGFTVISLGVVVVYVIRVAAFGLLWTIRRLLRYGRP